MTSASYQLPDVLEGCRSLTLRTNHHCRSVTEASLKWLDTVPGISKDDLEYVNSAKFGLLASLCFPTCDAPQLQMVTDFWTLFSVTNRRALRNSQPGWSENSSETDTVSLTDHELLKWCVRFR